MEPEGSLPHSQASATRPYPSGGVVYLRIVLSPEEASCLRVFRNSRSSTVWGC
jgi:hypothetical protein